MGRLYETHGNEIQNADAPYYSRFGQFTLILFPISLLIVVWKHWERVYGYILAILSSIGTPFQSISDIFTRFWPSKMGRLYETHGNEIQIHPSSNRNKHLAGANEALVKNWRSTRVQSFWTQVNSDPNSSVRDVIVAFAKATSSGSNGSSRSSGSQGTNHATFAVRDRKIDDHGEPMVDDQGRPIWKWMIAFDITQNAQGRGYHLREITYETEGQINVFLSGAKIIEICKTKLDDDQLGKLALWCRMDKYEKIMADCVRFARYMAEEIAVHESDMTENEWQSKKDEITPHEGVLRKKLVKKYNKTWLGRTTAFLTNAPYYSRFGQFTLILFPISLLIVVWKHWERVYGYILAILSSIGTPFQSISDIFTRFWTWSMIFAGGMMICALAIMTRKWVIRKRAAHRLPGSNERFENT